MKHQLSMILAALLLSSVLIGCGDTTGTVADTQNGTPDTGAAADTSAETEAARPAVNLPDDLDFGGREFRQLTFNWQGYRFYFFAEEETGDVMNDAVYSRRRTVEDTLNVKFTTNILEADSTAYVPNELKKTVLAGDDAYDQVLFHCIDGVSSMSSAGYLYNLDNLPYIDMDAEWWNETQMDALRLGKNTYFAVNDYMLPCPYIVYFNKEMVQNYDMENPYDLVYNGTWTLDKFASMAKAAVADLNGDGTMSYTDDQFGCTTTEISKYSSFMPGCGQFITSLDETTGRIALAMNTDKTVSIISTFKQLYDANVFYQPKNGEYGDDQLTMDSGRVMFVLNTLSDAEKMREYTVDFGFLPYPKYDEAQETYYSMDWGGLMGVPTTITDPECVGAVLELLAYTSGDTVIPAYYDTILTGKLTRDEDARKMLDIVFDTIVYEVGGNYFGFSGGFNSLFYAISNLSLAGKDDFGSFYAKQEKSANKVIDTYYEDLEEVEAADS